MRVWAVFCFFILFASTTQVVEANEGLLTYTAKDTVTWGFTNGKEAPVRQVVFHKQFVDLVVGNPGHVTRLKIDFSCSGSIVLFAMPDDNSLTVCSHPSSIIVYVGNTIVRLSMKIDTSFQDLRALDPYEGVLCLGKYSDVWKYWSKITFSPFMLVFGAHDYSLSRERFHPFEIVFYPPHHGHHNDANHSGADEIEDEAKTVYANVRGHRYPLKLDLGNDYTLVPRELFHNISGIDMIINRLHIDVDHDDITTRLINGFDRTLVKKNPWYADHSITLGRYFGHNFVVFYDAISGIQRMRPSFHLFTTGDTEPFYTNFGLVLFTAFLMMWISFSLVKHTSSSTFSSSSPAPAPAPVSSMISPFSSSSPSTFILNNSRIGRGDGVLRIGASHGVEWSGPHRSFGMGTTPAEPKYSTVISMSTPSSHTSSSSPVIIADNHVTQDAEEEKEYAALRGMGESKVEPVVVMFLEIYGYLAVVLVAIVDVRGMMGTRNFFYLMATTSQGWYIAFIVFTVVNALTGLLVTLLSISYTYHRLSIRRIFFETAMMTAIYLFSTYQYVSHSILFVMVLLASINITLRLVQTSVAFITGRYLVFAIGLVYSALSILFLYFYTMVPINNHFFSDFDDNLARLMLVFVLLVGLPTLLSLAWLINAVFNTLSDRFKSVRFLRAQHP